MRSVGFLSDTSWTISTPFPWSTSSNWVHNEEQQHNYRLYSLFNKSHRKETLLITSQPDNSFVYKESYLWNTFKRSPEGREIVDSTSQIGFIKSRVKKLINIRQILGDENDWFPEINFVSKGKHLPLKTRFNSISTLLPFITITQLKALYLNIIQIPQNVCSWLSAALLGINQGRRYTQPHTHVLNVTTTFKLCAY